MYVLVWWMVFGRIHNRHKHTVGHNLPHPHPKKANKQANSPYGPNTPHASRKHLSDRFWNRLYIMQSLYRPPSSSGAAAATGISKSSRWTRAAARASVGTCGYPPDPPAYSQTIRSPFASAADTEHSYATANGYNERTAKPSRCRPASRTPCQRWCHPWRSFPCSQCRATAPAPAVILIISTLPRGTVTARKKIKESLGTCACAWSTLRGRSALVPISSIVTFSGADLHDRTIHTHTRTHTRKEREEGGSSISVTLGSLRRGTPGSSLVPCGSSGRRTGGSPPSRSH